MARTSHRKAETVSQFVNDMISDILGREGGFVNHPNDRGGATKWGVTQATLSGFRGRPATVEDVKKLTKAEASRIYRERYYEGPRLNGLPEAIQPFVFDSSINHGPGRAIKILQCVLNAAQFPCGAVDGALGPQTCRAAERASKAMGGFLLAALIEERRMFYELIVEMDSTQGIFLKGWLNRLKDFEAEGSAA